MRQPICIRLRQLRRPLFWSRRKRRGRALSIILSGLASATVFGVPLGLMLAQRFGWRSTLAVVASLALVAAVGVAFRLHLERGDHQARADCRNRDFHCALCAPCSDAPLLHQRAGGPAQVRFRFFPTPDGPASRNTPGRACSFSPQV
ncbi:MFS transporter [Burkholderia multivorans]|uniref:MFS transporter n=1 Tax=Burkholderia multivorans TaxID=87883 RepID=UPI00338E03DB